MKIIDKSLALAAGMSLVFFACNSGKSDLHSGVLLKNMDTTVIPGNNFTQYVNGTWMKTHEIPADKPSYGAGYILFEKSQDNVKAIIENAAKSKTKDGSDEQKIGDLYAGYLDMKTRDSIGVAPLQSEFTKIDALKSTTDLASYFGYANQIGLSVPFSLGVDADFKDPKKYMLYTMQSGLGLPDREYYFSQDPASKNIRVKYLEYIENMLKLAGVPDAKAKSVKVMALETLLASKQMKKEETRNIAAMYNPIATKDLKTLMPDFDWQAMFSSVGVKHDTLVVTQLNYSKDLNNIIKDTPLDTWKDYLKWGIINRAGTSLTTAIDNESFKFNSTVMNGIKEQQPRWRRAVNLVSGNLGEMIGKLYVEKHFPPEAKEKMLKLVGNLLKAYEVSIKNLDWMSPNTKKQALEKLKKFTPKIGYPDKWIDYSSLKIAKNDLYGNRKRAAEFQYKRSVDRLDKPVDRTEWTMTPQTVNAYYNPSMNEIVFPAAILQPPFFDMNADDAVNYGGIGGVIGHEIGHGFDDQGSTFDGDGVLRNWWTPKDQSEFKKRTSALVSQYSGIDALPGLKINGEFTQGENIGDLGGLSIALKAYKASLNGKEAPVMDGFTGEQRVFIGWAQVWLDKSNAESIRSQVTTDPHSPAAARVNQVVRNVPEFYSAFKVKPGDSLYLAPDKRVKIW